VRMRRRSLASAITNLVIYICHEGPGPVGVPSSKPYRAVAFDDEGNGFEVPFSGGAGRSDAANAHFHLLQGITFDAYPRHCKIIGVRILPDEKDAKDGTTLAEFHIPNPHPGPFPTWVPESMPDVKRAGEVVATLTEFTTGLSVAHPKTTARQEPRPTAICAINDDVMYNQLEPKLAALFYFGCGFAPSRLCVKIEVKPARFAPRSGFERKAARAQSRKGKTKSTRFRTLEFNPNLNPSFQHRRKD
jgi:hypothetical protein